MGDSDRQGRQGRQGESCDHGEERKATERAGGAVRGFWSDAEWIYCTDGKLRPVEPGSFPLAHGAPARVGRLRGYGNAINAQVAASFVKAYLEARS
jgi:DNA (cytosine-5)-methyltransferase 1